MKRAIAFEFSRVTEAAALAAFDWIGRGDKNAADNAAVKAMRQLLKKKFQLRLIQLMELA